MFNDPIWDTGPNSRVTRNNALNSLTVTFVIMYDMRLGRWDAGIGVLGALIWDTGTIICHIPRPASWHVDTVNLSTR